jgi:hypothetical protein
MRRDERGIRIKESLHGFTWFYMALCGTMWHYARRGELTFVKFFSRKRGVISAALP